MNKIWTLFFFLLVTYLAAGCMNGSPVIPSPPPATGFSGNTSSKPTPTPLPEPASLSSAQPETFATPTPVNNADSVLNPVLKDQTTPTSTLSNEPFIDDFSGSALNSGWAWVKSNHSSWSLESDPGYLTVYPEYGELSADIPNDLKNVLLRLPPNGDWVMTSRFMMTDPSQTFEQAGLIVYSNDDRFLLIKVEYNFGSAIVSFAENVGMGSAKERIFTPIPSPCYLKIEKSANNYTTSYSSNGVNWTPVKKWVKISLSDFKVGLFANGFSYNRLQYAYKTLFDWIKIIPK